MGIPFQWHKELAGILDGAFPNGIHIDPALIYGKNKHVVINTVAQDFMVWLRRIFPKRMKLKTWGDFWLRFYERIITLTQIAKRVIIGLDNNLEVPRAKGVTQASRVVKADIMPTPRNPAQMFMVRNKLPPDFNAFLNNREMRVYMFQWLVLMIEKNVTLAAGHEIIICGMDPVPVKFVGHDNPNEPVTKVLMHDCCDKIGEFDVAVGKWIHYYAVLEPKSNFLMISVDGDEFPIGLNMWPDRYSVKDNKFVGDVFMQFGTIGVGREARIVSMNMCSTRIRSWMEKKTPTLPQPVHTFSLGFILGGTDFFDGLPGIGAGKVLEHFLYYLKTMERVRTAPEGASDAVARAFLPTLQRYYPEQQTLDDAKRVLAKPLLIVDDRCTYDHNAAVYKETQDLCIGAEPPLRGVEMNEPLLEYIIRLIYTFKIDKDAARRGVASSYKVIEQRRSNDARWNEAKSAFLLSPGELPAHVRRVTWTVLYWINGYRHRGGFTKWHTNPLLQDNGVSVFGYVPRDPEMLKLAYISAKDVRYAKSVVGTEKAHEYFRMLRHACCTEPSGENWCFTRTA